jgi:Tfp pilus assembly protein PilE
VVGKTALSRRFTLTQLLVLLVAVAVIIAIAVPSCHTRALRSRREEATQALHRIQAAEEHYLVQYNRYAARLAPKPPLGLGLPDGDPNCRSFSLDQNGIRNAQDAGGADRTALCWR